MSQPLLFAFGLHLHQPVGNFDWVFEQHLREVYQPLIDSLDAANFWPITLHVSGPLLDWLKGQAPQFLDRLAEHVATGKIELLLAGHDEPILAILSRADRLEQIARMQEALRGRFGIRAAGLWLTERVWEPDLVQDLAVAGVSYVLVDDRHFLVSGFTREELHRPYRSESGGLYVNVFPIDERLRYLVPFRPPHELAKYLRDLRAAGQPMAILADDGEKFGGWPGTLEWVYQRGWMKDFTATIADMTSRGEIRLVTFSEALARVPSGGLAYLPSASYREMESWALPPESALRLARLEADLGPNRLAGPDGSLIRGSHWRNFLVRYSESNRMHKKMMAISALARRKGDPPAVRRAIGRAQCNDAYWHGVFGGLYLPHLRDAVWRELARAERELRAGQKLEFEWTDIDGDGYPELWAHGEKFSAIVAPHRSGCLEDWTVFEAEWNYGNTITRRREAYHEEAIARSARKSAADEAGGTASIHDLEDRLTLTELPPFDEVDRALLVERIIDGFQHSAPNGEPSGTVLKTWTTVPEASTKTSDGELIVSLAWVDMTKIIHIVEDGSIVAEFRWELNRYAGAWFTTELSIAGEVSITSDAAHEWRYDIETVAKSERGLDRTTQGQAVVLAWPIERGEARLRLEPGKPSR